ncbi:MAG: type II secretion system protein [Dehalococcoidia bacterium]
MRTRQSGFTVVELLVAVAISGVIASLMGTAIYQFFTVTGRGSDEMTAVHNIQNAAHWFSIDGQQARPLPAPIADSASLTLTMPDDSTIIYAIPPGTTNLIRTAGASELTVARNITDIVFSDDGRVVTMDITSAPGGGWGVSEQKIYTVYRRPTV